MRMHFRLAQGSACFIALMQKVLGKFHDFCFFCMDDILVHNRYEDHLRHLKQIFEQIRKAALQLKLSKCVFFKRHLNYTQTLISGEGIYSLKEKVASLINIPSKWCNGDKTYQSLAFYYRKIIANFSDIMRPLTDLTKKNLSFVWTPKCWVSLNTINIALTNRRILFFLDPNHDYVLFTDTSKHSWSGVLTLKKVVQLSGEEMTWTFVGS